MALDDIQRHLAWKLQGIPQDGDLLGAAGAVEAIFCILAIRDQIAPPTINLDDPVQETAVDLAANAAVRRRIDVALSNSFGFGGTNASLVIGKVRD